MNNINNFISILKNKPFINSLINELNAEVLAVGGVVRDLILNKPNKDIDLIIRKIPIDLLISQLQKFGKVDVVGKSFGVIKFIDSDGLDYDLALPRKEKPSGEGGYHGFDVQSDENLPIEDDLIRRDARFNAMAININTGKFIDPLGGLNDIENKQISAANPEAFSDDPLRMLRMVSFASRFGFNIESKTMEMIIDNASRISEIPADRILIEFDKIIKKGDIRIGVQLLKDTKLFENIFGFELKQSVIDRSPFEEVKTMGEFVYLMIRLLPNPSEFYLKRFGTEDAKRNKNYKDIKALDLGFNYQGSSPIEARSIAHNMFITNPNTIESLILPEVIGVACQELLSGKYPKTVNELALNGQDLMNLGLRGKEIGDTQKRFLINIYADKVANTAEDLTSFLNKGNIQENLNETIKGGEYVMYHGTDHDITNFTDEFVGGSEALDQEGPGIYFTNSIKEASMYGKNIYKVTIKPRKLTDIARKSVVSIANITSLIKSAPHFKDHLTNWGENTNMALRNAIVSIIEYSENEKDLFQQIWIDFYKYNPVQFVKNMVKLGFDGQMIKRENANNIILYNPNVITSMEKLEDNQELNSTENMNESFQSDLKAFKAEKELQRQMKPSDLPKDQSGKYIMKDISYTAIVLNERSKAKIIEAFKDKIPKGYRIIVDHMTICLGRLPENQRDEIGLTKQLTVESFAIDDKVAAVGVTGYPSNNQYPHIIIAVNDVNGGKAMMSNYLTNWEKALRIRVSGVVTEVPYTI